MKYIFQIASAIFLTVGGVAFRTAALIVAFV